MPKWADSHTAVRVERDTYARIEALKARLNDLAFAKAIVPSMKRGISLSDVIRAAVVALEEKLGPSGIPDED